MYCASYPRQYSQIDIQGWGLSPRGAGFLFGADTTKNFAHNNAIDLIARAHQLAMEGFKLMFDQTIVTVWSAPNYCYRYAISLRGFFFAVYVATAWVVFMSSMLLSIPFLYVFSRSLFSRPTSFFCLILSIRFFSPFIEVSLPRVWSPLTDLLFCSSSSRELLRS